MLLGLVALIAGLAVASSVKAVLLPSGRVLVIVICGIFIYGVIVLVVTLLFVAKYAVRTELCVRDVGEYCEGKGFGRNYRIYFKR